MKADAPVNNFEFKVYDDRENVYWIKKLNVEYPRTWAKQRIKKRHLAPVRVGPSPGTELRTVRKIEFVVSTGTGGPRQQCAWRVDLRERHAHDPQCVGDPVGVAELALPRSCRR